MSDDLASLASPEEMISSVSHQDWSSLQESSHYQQGSSHEAVSKGPHTSELQLRYGLLLNEDHSGCPCLSFPFRYLLQMVLEANCLEIAALISVVLKDALALIRIVNAARTSPDCKTIVNRLHHGLCSLEEWAKNDW